MTTYYVLRWHDQGTEVYGTWSEKCFADNFKAMGELYNPHDGYTIGKVGDHMEHLKEIGVPAAFDLGMTPLGNLVTELITEKKDGT